MSSGRATLKKSFSEGELPTQEDFHNLIDSMLHMEDEGFSKSPEHGLEITSAEGKTALMSFFRQGGARQAQWTLDQDKQEQLNLRRKGVQPASAALLSLDGAQRVGVNNESPRYTLDVGGVAAARGRVGTRQQRGTGNVLLANGEWQLLLSGLRGCVAFEVVASASGGQRSGHHAVMHAMALNAHNPDLGWPDGWLGDTWRLRLDRWFNRRKRIRCHNAWYSERCHRIELCWRPAANGDAEEYELAIRTQCNYGDGVALRAHVTELWPNDPDTDPGADPPDRSLEPRL